MMVWRFYTFVLRGNGYRGTSTIDADYTLSNASYYYPIYYS